MLYILYVSLLQRNLTNVNSPFGLGYASVERLDMLTGREWKVDPQELTNSMMPFQARCASWSMGTWYGIGENTN